MRVLILREPEAAEETAGALAALGHEPLRLPLQAIVPLGAPPPPGRFAALVVTSRNALPALSRHLSGTDLPLLAVGAATAARLRGAGFAIAVTGEGAAASLVSPAAELAGRAGLPLLLALGRSRSADLETGLAARNAPFTVWETYETRPRRPEIAEIAALFAAGRPEAALLLSATQAEGFAALLAAHGEFFRPMPRLFCLSARIAARLPEELRPFATISPRRDVSSLLAGLA
ncbi:hypothetical protein GCM10011390_29200 [Aureimonas endophytica]|uniref:Tetrapyrrole biosynthesis uroporphyrinogen III synthase domain-containing protein n=1 Tax=Aureimonas endophytica TaxID=2027858 RepID=A0A916ZPX4_9HYPH|nr:uroporphyrinogen-III synthase [Aureimonas endophytica]GGE08298.1 hypothetical protein GCM10011390_29200 [Aureimonas endophytica]